MTAGADGGNPTGRPMPSAIDAAAAVRDGSLAALELVEDCLAWLECRVIAEPRNQAAYDLFLAEVVAAWADPEAFSDGRWHFPDPQRRSIHYLAGGSFFATGEEFQA